MSIQEPYNPLAKSNLGESIAGALLRTPAYPLSDTKRLAGAGIYALYYIGDFPPYAPMRDSNIEGRFERAIYVGKAVPKGSRKGSLELETATGKALHRRLSLHRRSIMTASNLESEDFHYRALTVDDVWISLGERVAIERFQPLWNKVIDGFGNNKPGQGREGQVKSLWDTLHPGRRSELPDNPLTESAIRLRIQDFFSGQLPASELLTEVDEDEQ
ncbi:Eco29kI family restriction endonuclease [Burkholderia pseudomallei]|uniref:Eco29kI family restriction endonuclease n=1 Tax=Burkholderia pseudomallei TaxID=28450 RepID=UPI001606BD01|nr:Eco29kI family restriction endonuclease [Burkholderia pseudomallei]